MSFAPRLDSRCPCGKVAYPTKAEAKAHQQYYRTKARRQDNRPPARIYRCDNGLGRVFHLTSWTARDQFAA